jgi:hypothetical protein
MLRPPFVVRVGLSTKTGTFSATGRRGTFKKCFSLLFIAINQNEVRDFIRGPLNLSLASVDQLQCVTYMRWLLTTVLTQRY